VREKGELKMNTHTEMSIQNKVLKAAELLISIPNFISTCKSNVCATAETVASSDADITQKWIWSRLEKLGVYEDEESNEILVSNDCQEGDARRFFCENGQPNLPIARFKRVWTILKGSKIEEKKTSQPDSDIKDLISAVRPIGQFSDDELLAKYGLECAEGVVNELSKRAHGRNFIVFNDKVSGEINLELSKKFLKLARHKDTPSQIIIEEVYYKLYTAGQFPNAMYDECPLHHGVLLTEGYCDQCQISWSPVRTEERAFIRVIKDEGDAPTSRLDIRKLVTEASGDSGIIELKRFYPVIASKFEDLEEVGRLPSLKVRSSETCGVQDPFNAGKANGRY